MYIFFLIAFLLAGTGFAGISSIGQKSYAQESNCDPNAATVRRGSTGQEVQNLQNILLQLGYNIGGPTADGDFGPATEAAVKQFQQANGLTADGIVGPGTWSALCSAAGGNTQAPTEQPAAPTEQPAAPTEQPAAPTDEASISGSSGSSGSGTTNNDGGTPPVTTGTAK